MPLSKTMKRDGARARRGARVAHAHTHAGDLFPHLLANLPVITSINGKLLVKYDTQIKYRVASLSYFRFVNF